MTRDDGAPSAERHLVELLALGPRITGGAGEAAAARLVAERFRALGLETSVREFEVSRWPYRIASRVLPVAVALACACGGAALAAHPAVVASILAALVALVWLASIGHPRLERPFDLPDRVRSANVLGRTAREDSDRPVLVFSAHLDSKTFILPMGVQLFSSLVGLAATTALAIVAALAAFGISSSPAVVRPLSIAACAGFALAAANVRGRPATGALDNASGVAILLRLAETLPAALRGRAQLVFLATGAEEVGLAGAMRFARDGAEGLDPASTLFVNLDTLGTADVVRFSGRRDVLESSGAPIAEALRKRGLRTGRLRLLAGAGMDHQRFRAKGFGALSLTQGAGRAAWFAIHSARDVAARVDASVLDRIAASIEESAPALAAGIHR